MKRQVGTSVYFPKGPESDLCLFGGPIDTAHQAGTSKNREGTKRDGRVGDGTIGGVQRQLVQERLRAQKETNEQTRTPCW